MEDLILLMLNAGEPAIVSGIHAGLDILYGNIKNRVIASGGKIDDKVLEIITKSIADWTPKN